MTFLLLNNLLMVSIYCNCLTLDLLMKDIVRVIKCSSYFHLLCLSLFLFEFYIPKKMYFLMALAYHIALHERQFSLHHPQKRIEAVT